MRLFSSPSRATIQPPASDDLCETPRTPSILLTHDGWLVGDLVDVDGRVIDALASRESVGLMTSAGYRQVDRDDILAVVPPPRPRQPELRIAKRLAPVTVEVESTVTFSGTCHLLPGATVWDAWQRSSSGFLALTDALLEFPDGMVEPVDLVLVSRHAAAAGLRIA